MRPLLSYTLDGVHASACSSQDVELLLEIEGFARNAKGQNGITCNQHAEAVGERKDAVFQIRLCILDYLWKHVYWVGSLGFFL
jgi:hypothetical protein